MTIINERNYIIIKVLIPQYILSSQKTLSWQIILFKENYIIMLILSFVAYKILFFNIFIDTKSGIKLLYSTLY